MTDCQRKTWLGRLACRFEGRYDVTAAHGWGSIKSYGDPLPFLEAHRDKTYVRDVCTRCGKTIERMPANGS